MKDTYINKHSLNEAKNYVLPDEKLQLRARLGCFR